MGTGVIYPIGTVRIWHHGYRAVKLADGSWMLEHRLVMERLLGRKLLPSEHVHHKNENRQDNRPENLELLTKAEHLREHAPERKRIRQSPEVCTDCGADAWRPKLGRCVPCYDRHRKARNPELIDERKRDWEKRNPDKLREQRRRSYLRHREARLVKMREYNRRTRHPESLDP